ncbi:MarR family winged helix-turn-helix transcriptional regulator [Enterococcus mediterraneensis]|uniref:MarR family winged helix-turn-helix transcriptional regulator n=1 Tax=Enterococcus mediterraneensis TaxID=2364791 RepID=UPI000F05CD84|nr:transcriptional regulator [Enterococcus mediterraneensis]
MSYAEEAERKLEKLMLENRHGAFSEMEKSNRGELIVIKYLDHIDTAVSPKHLAETMNVSSARIAALLGNLEKKGQISRTIDPDDRRRIQVTLTKKGKVQAEMEKRKMQDKIIRVFKRMGEADTKKFVELAAKFIKYSHDTNKEEEVTSSEDL